MSNVLTRTWKSRFQFRLSTWLVLIGIMAWEMALRPRARLIYSTSWTGYSEFGTRVDDYATWTFQMSGNSAGENVFFGAVLEISPFPAVLYPALAVLTFIAWKFFQQRRMRRCERAIDAPGRS